MGLFSRFFVSTASLGPNARGHHICVQKNSIFVRSPGRKINHAIRSERSARIAIFPRVSTPALTRTIIPKT